LLILFCALLFRKGVLREFVLRMRIIFHQLNNKLVIFQSAPHRPTGVKSLTPQRAFGASQQQNVGMSQQQNVGAPQQQNVGTSQQRQVQIGQNHQLTVTYYNDSNGNKLSTKYVECISLVTATASDIFNPNIC
jgi:hypothetical protein